MATINSVHHLQVELLLRRAHDACAGGPGSRVKEFSGRSSGSEDVKSENRHLLAVLRPATRGLRALPCLNLCGGWGVDRRLTELQRSQRLP